MIFLKLYCAELSVDPRAGSSPFYILNIETGDPPAGWGVRRTISNKEFRTAEVFESNKTMFFTSIFCGSLFCGSAVHILDEVIANSGIFDGLGFLTLMLHTHAEEKRVRVRQMWARAGWDRMNST